jgi:hypothetical protein
MQRMFSGLTTCLLMIVGAACVGKVSAGAQTPIGPNQHFVGLVKGNNDDPIVYTVCAGPTSSDQEGPVAGGQTLSVAKVRAGTGFTGPFSQVYVWVAPTHSGVTPAQMKFLNYGVSRVIPLGWRVRCDGPGTVVFSSCPYLAPCAAGWVSDEVTVQFVNIAE